MFRLFGTTGKCLRNKALKGNSNEKDFYIFNLLLYGGAAFRL